MLLQTSGARTSRWDNRLSIDMPNAKNEQAHATHSIQYNLRGITQDPRRAPLRCDVQRPWLYARRGPSDQSDALTQTFGRVLHR